MVEHGKEIGRPQGIGDRQRAEVSVSWLVMPSSARRWVAARALRRGAAVMVWQPWRRRMPDTAVLPPIQGISPHWDRKEAAHRPCSGSGEEASSRPHPGWDASDSNGTPEAQGHRFRWSKGNLWAWLDLNQRSHPYERSTAECHEEGLGGGNL